MLAQNIIVGLVLLACAAYIIRRLWKRFTAPSCHCDAGCANCPLANSCGKAPCCPPAGEDWMKG